MDPATPGLALAAVVVVIVVGGGIGLGAALLMGLALVAAFRRTTGSVTEAGNRIGAYVVASGMARGGDERAERPGPAGREVVELSWAQRQRGAPRPVLVCGIELAHPLGLGVHVTQRSSALDPLVAVGVVSAVATGAPAFDDAFRVIVRDAARVPAAAALFGHPDVRASLASVPTTLRLDITDARVIVDEPGWDGLTVEHVEAVLGVTRSIALALVSAGSPGSAT